MLVDSVRCYGNKVICRLDFFNRERTVALLLQDFFIPFICFRNAVFPGEINFIHGILTDCMNSIKVPAQVQQQLCHRFGRLLYHVSVPAVCNPFRSAGAFYKNAGKAAGCRLPDDEAVRIKSGREQKQIGTGIPCAQPVPVIFGAGKNAFGGDAEFFRLVLQQLLVGALPDKDHTEILSGVMEQLHGIQDQRQALIGH